MTNSSFWKLYANYMHIFVFWVKPDQQTMLEMTCAWFLPLCLTYSGLPFRSSKTGNILTCKLCAEPWWLGDKQADIAPAHWVNSQIIFPSYQYLSASCVRGTALGAGDRVVKMGVKFAGLVEFIINRQLNICFKIINILKIGGHVKWKARSGFCNIISWGM